MVIAYLVDILVAGKMEQEHLMNLDQVAMECLNSAGMKLKQVDILISKNQALQI